MAPKCSKLKSRLRRFKKSSLVEICGLSLKWIEMPEEYGLAVRERLFPPLDNLLPLPFPGAL